MKHERYKFLVKCFSEGYKVDLRRLVVVNRKGKDLSTTNRGKRAPAVSLKGRYFSITEVISTWMGMDVIDNYCFYKDGNSSNYHPSNLIWADKVEGNKWSSQNCNHPNKKLDYKKVKFIRNVKLENGLTRKKLAERFGVSFDTIRDIRTSTKAKWEERVRMFNRIK